MYNQVQAIDKEQSEKKKGKFNDWRNTRLRKHPSDIFLDLITSKAGLVEEAPVLRQQNNQRVFYPEQESET